MCICVCICVCLWINHSSVVATLAGSGVFTYADGIGSQAGFRFPWGVALDANGNIVLGDIDNKRIRKITPSGVVSTFAGGVFGSAVAFAEGAGSQAGFGIPRGVAVDASGNVIVADDVNMRIRHITPAGAVSTLAGGGSNTYGYLFSADGVGTNVGFKNPIGVAVDKVSGSIVVCEGDNQRIRKLTPSAGIDRSEDACALLNANAPSRWFSVRVSMHVHVSHRSLHSFRIVGLACGGVGILIAAEAFEYDVLSAQVYRAAPSTRMAPSAAPAVHPALPAPFARPERSCRRLVRAGFTVRLPTRCWMRCPGCAPRGRSAIRVGWARPCSARRGRCVHRPVCRPSWSRVRLELPAPLWAWSKEYRAPQVATAP